MRSGHVEVGVLARDVTLGRQAGDRRRAVVASAREHAVAAVAVAQRAGARPVAVGRRDRLAEPDEVAVHREGHDPARSGFVAHVAGADRVEADEVGRVALELVAMRAQEASACPPGGTPRRRSAEPRRRGSPGGPTRAPRRARSRSRRRRRCRRRRGRRRRARCRRAGMRQASARGWGGAGSTDTQSPSMPAIRAPITGRSSASRPEEESERAERKRDRALQARHESRRAGVVCAPGLGGVVVRAEDDAGGGVGARAAGDDVLGRAAKEEPAQQVEAPVEVEVHRDGCEQDDHEADHRPLERHEPAGDRERAVRRVDQRPLGVNVGRLARRPCGRRLAAAARDRSRPGARRRFRPACPRKSTGGGSAPGVRRPPRAGDYRRMARLWLRVAGVAELADAMDSKSIALRGVWVRFPPPA